MSKKYLKNPEARHYFEWQEKQRERKDLPDYCIKTLNRVEKNAKKLERQEKGGNNYKDTQRKLQADKEKYYRQLKSRPKDIASTIEEMKKVMPPASEMNTTHYTLDSWKKSQGGNRENYMEAQQPYNFAAYLDRTLDLLGVKDKDLEKVDYGVLTPDASIKVIVIDDEYYGWLRKNRKEDTEGNRLAYMNTVSDEDADRLLHKNHLDVTYTACVIPVIVLYDNGVPPITRWELSKNTKDIIHNCLIRVFGESDVYFPGTVGKIDDVFKKEERLLEQAARYFDEGVTPKNYRDTEQKHKGACNAAIAAIPFVVRYVHSAISPVNVILEKEGPFRQNLYPDLVDFLDNEDFDEYENDADNVDDFAADDQIDEICLNDDDDHMAEVSFEDEGIPAAIHADIGREGVNAITFGEWIVLWTIPEFVEAMKASFENINMRFLRESSDNRLYSLGSLAR